jgi:MTH538 TIR-like domain (DUF1863)
MGFTPYLGLGMLGASVRHKIFVSYYHYADQYYRDAFEKAFGHLFISKSVQPGDISTNLSTEYIKRLILEDYITDASVLVVLIGSKTLCRKHVDWEISAALNKKVGGYSGLIGILLPDVPLLPNGNYHLNSLPARLADNVQSGYASIYGWNDITSSEENVRAALQSAFEARVSLASKIDNSRAQLGRDLCS